MHEIGLVFIPTFEPVGEEEFSKYNAKLGSRTQLKKIARALMQMSVAMGLEPGGTFVAAQKCAGIEVPHESPVWDYKWMLLSACVFMACLLCGWFVLKRGVQWVLKLDARIQHCERDIQAAQEQLADHYGFAAGLATRLDDCMERSESRGDAVDGLTVRVAVVEEDSTEGLSALEESLDCLRYGLMEIEGFVRFNSLTTDQRSHMLTQERANFVMWSVRTSAETTDAAETHVPEPYRDDGESAEEEDATEDEAATQPPGESTILLENMRIDQKIALAGERWTETNQIQQAILVLLDSTTGPKPEGLPTEVLTRIRNVFQRLHRCEMVWPRVARRLAALAVVTAANSELNGWLVRCSKDCNGRNQCEEVCSGTQMEHHACPYEADCPETSTYCPNGAEPRPCEFSDWSAWSEPLGCTGLCTRTRDIVRQNSCGGAACEGPLHDSAYCDGASACETSPKDCKLGPWGPWSACNANVTQQRERRRGVQDLPARGGAECDASGSRDCEMSSWMAWSPCTMTCGGGQRGRLRTILRHARNGGRHCADTLGETAPCGTGPCEFGESSNCILSSWSKVFKVQKSEWSTCNVADEKRRTRKVAQHAAAAGQACKGSLVEVLACFEASPPSASDCQLSVWSEWQLCDRSCGGGQTTRSRSIAAHAAAGGSMCTAALQETLACNTGSCSLYHQPCRPSAWSEWGACSCAPGSSTRTRSYVEADAGGQACDLVLAETKPCQTDQESWQKCEVQDCEISAWSEWKSCTKSCEGGMTERDRRVVKHASVGGQPCNFAQNQLMEVKPCGEGSCDVVKDCEDGVWGEWGGWSDCTKSCRGGFRLAHRRVTKEANQCGKPAEGVATKIESCNDGIHCSGSVDCELTEWTRWSDCDKPCSGVRERSRGIKVHPKDGGVPCGSQEKATSLSEMEHCPPEPGTTCDNPPPEGCKFGDWSEWSDCSATCDGGQMSRSRKVLPGPDGSMSPCEGKTLELAPCNTKNCGDKVDCQYGLWSDWGNCTKCGGQRFRSRSITQHPSFGGLECQASETMQTTRCPRECGEQLYWCAWSEWTKFSTCTKTCGAGNHVRQRTLAMTDQRPSSPLAVASSKKDCEGTVQDVQPCNLPACEACAPKDCELSEWSEWSSPFCEGICTRHRRVAVPNNECGKPCEGTLKSTKPCEANCHDKDCVLGEWSSWSACASSLDNKYRSRQVLEPGAFNGKACSLNSLNETASCLTGPNAPVDCSFTEWKEWNECSHSCGNGQQSRSRAVATQASKGGKACLGSLKSLKRCKIRPCAEKSTGIDCIWEQWSEWQECDGSQQVRRREIIHPADAVGEPCEGVQVETKGCGKDVTLPSDCDADVFSAWSEWSPCPKSCGGAQSSRSRIIKPHMHGGLHCSGTLLETQPCGQVSCPNSPNTVCQYSQWSRWSQCSVSCGEGYKERSRTIAVPALGGVEGCAGMLIQAFLFQADQCTSPPCHDGVDCVWGNWNEWSDCVPAPTECGIGYKRRNRSIATMPSRSGALCDPKPFEEVMPVSGCRGQAMCCVDGEWHDWQDWGECTASCGSGTRKRLRVLQTWQRDRKQTSPMAW
eukprot:s62_g4.t1